MSGTDLAHMASRIEGATSEMSRAVDRMDNVSKKLAYLFESGYGGNCLRLIELLEEKQREQTFLDLIQKMKETIKELIENMEQPPEPDCSCHLCSPCNDCTAWAGFRELIGSAKEQIKEAEDIIQSK